MPSDKIVRLPPTTTFTVEQALNSALQDAGNMEDVIIVGYNKDGELFVRSSAMDRKLSLWILEQAKIHTLNP